MWFLKLISPLVFLGIYGRGCCLYWGLPDIKTASSLDLRNILSHICSYFPNVKKTLWWRPMFFLLMRFQCSCFPGSSFFSTFSLSTFSFSVCITSSLSSPSSYSFFSSLSLSLLPFYHLPSSILLLFLSFLSRLPLIYSVPPSLFFCLLLLLLPLFSFKPTSLFFYNSYSFSSFSHFLSQPLSRLLNIHI